MFLSYKYQLKPNKIQLNQLDLICDEQCILYNAALQERIDCYNKTKK